MYVLRPCRPFKHSFLKIQQFLPLPQSSLVFTSRSYEDLSSQHWNPGLCGLTWAGIAHSQGIPPNFYPLYVNVGPPVPILPLPLPLHATPHLLTSPLCLHVSAPPTCLDECGSFKSLVVRLPYTAIFDSPGCYLF